MRLSPATKTDNQSSWENQSSYPEPFRGTTGLGNKIITLFVFAGVLRYFFWFVCLFPFFPWGRSYASTLLTATQSCMEPVTYIVDVIFDCRNQLKEPWWQSTGRNILFPDIKNVRCIFSKQITLLMKLIWNGSWEQATKNNLRSWTFPCAFTARRYVFNFINFFNLTFKSDYLL